MIKLVLLMLFNLSDASFTAYWIRLGIAEEGNPLMAQVLLSGEVLFFIVKMSIALIACLVFYNTADLRLSRVGLNLAMFIYLLVNIYHLTILFNLV